MAGLSGPRNTPEMQCGSERTMAYPVEANTTLYNGALASLDKNGLLVPAQAKGTAPLDAQIVVGVVRGLVGGRPGENPINESTVTLPGSNLPAGAASAISAYVKSGIVLLDIGGSSISQANVGALCFAEDDHTVYLTDNSTNRFCAGRIVQIESATQCWVDTTDKSAIAA